jgi:hypothetical protein
MRASHDQYGKDLFHEILGNRWANWFSEVDRSVSFNTVIAKLDGVIRRDDLSCVECAVEIEATNFKQIRGALLGLARHSATKKLFMVIKAQDEVRKNSDQEIRDTCAEAWKMLIPQSPSDFRCVVLTGTGETPAKEVDRELIQGVLRDLKII